MERIETLATKLATDRNISIEQARSIVRTAMIHLALENGMVEEAREYARSLGAAV